MRDGLFFEVSTTARGPFTGLKPLATYHDLAKIAKLLPFPHPVAGFFAE